MLVIYFDQRIRYMASTGVKNEVRTCEEKEREEKEATHIIKEVGSSRDLVLITKPLEGDGPPNEKASKTTINQTRLQDDGIERLHHHSLLLLQRKVGISRAILSNQPRRGRGKLERLHSENLGLIDLILNYKASTHDSRRSTSRQHVTQKPKF
jgi:hypothetical protein